MFAKLYDCTSPKLFGLILRIQRDRALAEDVLQDVYLRVWRSAGAYAPEAGRPMPWLLIGVQADPTSQVCASYSN